MMSDKKGMFLCLLMLSSMSMDTMMMPGQTGGLFIFYKVKSKPSLHREVALTLKRYEKRRNGFDIGEGFPMECQSYQNVIKL